MDKKQEEMTQFIGQQLRLDNLHLREKNKRKYNWTEMNNIGFSVIK